MACSGNAAACSLWLEQIPWEQVEQGFTGLREIWLSVQRWEWRTVDDVESVSTPAHCSPFSHPPACNHLSLSPLMVPAAGLWFPALVQYSGWLSFLSFSFSDLLLIICLFSLSTVTVPNWNYFSQEFSPLDLPIFYIYLKTCRWTGTQVLESSSTAFQDVHDRKLN